MSQVSTTTTVFSLPVLRRSLVPSKWEDTVRTVTMAEYREVGLSLSHAFAADELSQYLVDSDDMSHHSAEHKWKLHVDIMTKIVAAHFLCGTITTIGPDYDCVGVWLPPGANMDGWLFLLRSGLWRLYFQLSPEGRRRYYDELIPLLDETKREVMGPRDDACYYLVYIGTKPGARGKGYARRILEHMIQKADSDHRPIYLESSSLSNNAYYAKFGFTLKKSITLTRGRSPVSLYIMVREPLGGGFICDSDVYTLVKF